MQPYGLLSTYLLLRQQVVYTKLLIQQLDTYLLSSKLILITRLFILIFFNGRNRSHIKVNMYFSIGHISLVSNYTNARIARDYNDIYQQIAHLFLW